MYEDIASIINDAAERGIYKKTVLSKCTDKSVKRCTVSMFRHCGGGTGIQLETLLRDGKAIHKNLPQEELTASVLSLLGLYRQADIITTAGSCTVMISERGKVHVKNSIKAGEAELAEIQGHDRKKTHLLSPDAPFLYPLGISDAHGRLLDSRRSKYKQINRFLELLDDVYPKLPQSGPLTVCDLCCGKSVLAFAVYRYLTFVRGRQVEMYGVTSSRTLSSYPNASHARAAAQDCTLSAATFLALSRLHRRHSFSHSTLAIPLPTLCFLSPLNTGQR